MAVLLASVLAVPLALPSPSAAQTADAFTDGAEPWTESDCSGEVPIVAGSDAKAQSDIYSAITLAGVVGTDCVILAGPRDGDMLASQRARLDAASAGGYIVGGTAAVPAAKTASRTMTRLAGADRWGTAQLVGSEARSLSGGSASVAPAPGNSLTAPNDVQQPGVHLRGAEPWIASDCAGDIPIVVGSDAKAQSDIYSAITLAGVIGTDCVILAGPRDGNMPASQRTRLDAANEGGFVTGGIAAVPTAKIASRDMTRLAGTDRWGTAQLVGRHASGDTTAGTSTADEPTDDAETPTSTSGSYTAVSAGGAHTCALRTDGTIACWGDNRRLQADAPPGNFTAVSAGGAFTCALRTDSTIACWGDNRSGRTEAPSGTFTALSAGQNATCALRSSGAITCWGDSQYAVAVPGRFTAVSAGLVHACGLRDNGTIACWGETRFGLADAPSATFTALSIGAQSCGLRDYGTIACWGPSASRYADVLPSGKFTAVAAGGYHACGLRDNGTITCWGDDRSGPANAQSGKFTAVSAGGHHACGLRDNGTIACWGPNGIGQTEGTSGPLTDSNNTPSTAQGRILKSRFFACGVLGDGITDCRWLGSSLSGVGDLILVIPETPPGEYVDIVSQSDVDDRFMCLQRADGQVRCWAAQRQWFSPPNGTYASLQPATGAGICGLRTDHTVACWDSSRAWSTAPSGTFDSLHQTASDGICGLRTDDTIACWDPMRTWEAPIGMFAYVAPSVPGRPHQFSNCGLRTNGTVACWNARGVWDGTPTGVFTALYHDSVGDAFCGLRPNGTAVCWAAWGGEMMGTPESTFTSLRVLENEAVCGARSDGMTVCWDARETWTARHSVELDSIVSLYLSVCGLRPDKSAACWHRGETWSATPGGEFTSLVPFTSWHVCGHRVDGRFACWTDDEELATVRDSFTSIQLANRFPTWCGLRHDRNVTCSFDVQRRATPRGAFTSLIVGDTFHMWCGLRNTGAIECWNQRGAWDWGKGGPEPAGKFEGLRAMNNSFCGLRANRTIACWDVNYDTAEYHNRYRVPSEPLAAVAIDTQGIFGCVLSANGRLHCWEG